MLKVSEKTWKNVNDLEMLAKMAIEAAVASDWTEAAKINKKIVSLSEKDVEAFNRLARAQVCAGEIKKAEKTYKKVLGLDPYNPIAKKNIEKLAKIDKNNGQTVGSGNGNSHNFTSRSFSNFFLYEPGKTKMIQLLNPAQSSTLAELNCAEKLELNLKKHSISITTYDGTYLGALPDDLAHKLLAYIAGGNKYEVYVKYATTKNLTVFIKEVERSARFENQPSFQSNSKAN